MPSTQPTFVEPAVHDYIDSLIRGETDLMRRIRRTCEAEELPAIAPETGRMLQVLAVAGGARRVLEVGCLHGYSALWLANADPRVRVETVEIDPEMAATARSNFEEAGVADRVTIHQADASELLPRLEGPYDLVFLDADKEALPLYVREARRLLRPGGVLAIDNALWGGRAVEESSDPATRAIRETTGRLLTDPALVGTLLPLGDGLAVSTIRH